MRGYGPLAAGVIMLPGALPTLACGPISGRLVATRGARSVLAGGTLALGAGLFAPSLPPAAAPLWQILAPALLIGIGYGLINTPVSAVAVSTLPSDQAGVAAATASSARNISRGDGHRIGDPAVGAAGVARPAGG